MREPMFGADQQDSQEYSQEDDMNDFAVHLAAEPQREGVQESDESFQHVNYDNLEQDNDDFYANLGMRKQLKSLDISCSSTVQLRTRHDGEEEELQSKKRRKVREEQEDSFDWNITQGSN
jgi:hypothetical protein